MAALHPDSGSGNTLFGFMCLLSRGGSVRHRYTSVQLVDEQKNS